MDLVAVAVGFAVGAFVTTLVILGLMIRTGASAPAIDTLDGDERISVSIAIVDARIGGTGILRVDGGRIRRLDPSEWILTSASARAARRADAMTSRR